MGTTLMLEKPLKICKSLFYFLTECSYYHLLQLSSLAKRLAVDSAAIDKGKFKMRFEKIINFYQNLQAKKGSHAMSHFGHIDAGEHTISHVLAKGIPTNTHKQERYAG